MLYKFIQRLKSICRFIIGFLDNKRAEVTIPDNILTELARCFATDIRAFFSIKSNQEAYEKWLQARNQQVAKDVKEED